MSIELIRVIHKQVIRPGLSRTGSILLDKMDTSQGNSSSPPYAQNRKQPVYVPFADATTPTFAGYVDLIQTDNVKLANEHPKGVIVGLNNRGLVDIITFQSNLITTAVVTAAVHDSPSSGDVTITISAATTYLSVTPTLTSVRITTLGGVVQTVQSTDFDAASDSTHIVIKANKITGSIIAGWKVQIFANNKLSNLFTVT